MKSAYLFIFSLSMGCAPAMAQTTVNNLKTNVLSLTKQGSTPSNAATGTLKFYGKSDDKLYTVTSGGTETQIGPPSFASVGSSPAATGASISGNTITLQPASGTQPGLMTAGSQTLGGAKQWNGGQNLASYLDFDSAAAPSTTGDNVTLASPTKVTNVLADAALNSIAGITGPGNARLAVYINSSGEDIIFRDNSGSASVGDKIRTGSGADYTVIDGSSVSMVYDTANGVWRIMGGPGPVAGTVGVANGGTGLTSGTSGGILGFTASGTIASSAALTAGQVVLGGGAGATPTTLAAGSQYQVLRMGASSPAYGALSLDQAAAISGTLPVANGGTGYTGGTWTSWVPTVTISGATSPVAVNSGGRYLQIGKLVVFWVYIQYTYSGVASGLSFTLPVASLNSSGIAQTFVGRNVTTGLMLQGVVASSSSTVNVFKVDNTTPLNASNDGVTISGTYQAD